MNQFILMVGKGVGDAHWPDEAENTGEKTHRDQMEDKGVSAEICYISC